MKQKYLNFLLYFIVVFLLNIVSITLFTRIDLTENKIYSLSKESKNIVKDLSVPLTIKIFFTSNLPAPHNNTERYLHDLMEEYSLASNKFFNYQFFSVSADEEKTLENRKLAEEYGIYPVQIQNIEQDQVKFQKAFMGMVLINGDIMETIPAITSTEGLEYKITSTIRKMNNKISKLNNLKGKVSVNVLISSNLKKVMNGIEKLNPIVKNTVEKINDKNFNKIQLIENDPSSNQEAANLAEKNNVVKLQWATDKNQKNIQSGFAGLVVNYGKNYVTIQLIEQVQTLFGVQYKLSDQEELEKSIEKAVESVININTEIGYLADHGTLNLGLGFTMPGQQTEESISNFNKLLSKDYSIKRINLTEEDIPVSLKTLIIAGAKENFTDYELFQIDQFLMRGGNLCILTDPFKEIMPQQNNQMMFSQNQGPIYLPLNTGLEKLLQNYGIKVEKAYVLDKECFKQNIPQAFGGGQKEIFFAPMIKNENISKELSFMKNIKGLVMLKAAPIEINKDKNKENKVYNIVSSSKKSWEMKGRVNLNPMFLKEPNDEKSFKQYQLATLVEGKFNSYFKGKETPIRKAKEDDKNEKNKKKSKNIKKENNIKSSGIKVEKCENGKIFILGTSEILKDNIIDKEGIGPNAQFILNAIDYLNGRVDNALMRSKNQKLNPLKKIEPGTRTFIKVFNIAGLPVIVIIAGLFMFLKRQSRKKSIEAIFKK